MTGDRVRWTNGVRRRSLLNPVYAAALLFHPAWIPPALDPSIDTLRRVRTIAGLLTCFGVHVALADFSIPSPLSKINNVVLILLTVHPVTVGVMLLVWRKRGHQVRTLRVPVLRGFILLASYVGALLILIQLTIASPESETSPGAEMIHIGVALWLFCFVIVASLAVIKNLFGSAAIHPSLPALLATIITWLAALLDLNTDEVVLGVVLVLSGPVTVTAVAVLELSRLRRHHGIELLTHPGAPPQPGQPRPGGGADFQPFWFAVPVTRPLFAEDGSPNPVAQLTPGTWYLAVEQRCEGLVAQTQDGHRGVLRDSSDIERG
ncbi:hypothetical protein [Streptomyces sp. AC602_WCS936]|uniref:hypothetical protein n=1 Tax=Streptomyces sp. AC602_WCS936 TaxID=2823685 RepID=UPI0020B7062F|nr:hypothetical protein [Streptomyces sp. AC602_WCS936]